MEFKSAIVWLFKAIKLSSNLKKDVVELLEVFPFGVNNFYLKIFFLSVYYLNILMFKKRFREVSRISFSRYQTGCYLLKGFIYFVSLRIYFWTIPYYFLFLNLFRDGKELSNKSNIFSNRFFTKRYTIINKLKLIGCYKLN